MLSLSATIVLLYLFILKFIAHRAHRHSVATLEDFFVLGRSLSGPLLWGTILATIINTLAFTAVPGLIYRGGVLFGQMWVVVLVAPACIYLLGPKLSNYARTHNILSQGELFARYYNCQQLAYSTALIAILSVTPFLVVQLTAIAKVAVLVSGGFVNYETALISFSTLIAAYIFFGGVRAVVWTDLLQSLCFFALLIFAAIAFSYWQGGYSAAITDIQNNRPELFSFSSKTRTAFINNILSWPFAFFLWPQLFQRLFMARDEVSIKKSAHVTWLLFGLCMFCIMTIGLMGTATFSDTVVDPDLLIAEMFRAHLPIGSALVLLALLASGMSTIDSGILALTAICARDFSSTKTANTSLYTAKRISLLIVAILTLLAMTEFGRGAIAPLVNLGASIATLLLWPVLGMTVYPRMTARSVILAYLSGGSCIALSALGLLSVGVGCAGFFAAALALLGSEGLSLLSGYRHRTRNKDRIGSEIQASSH